MKQRGVVLIQMLLLIAIITAIAATLVYQQQVQIGRIEAQAGWSQRQQWLDSGEAIAKATLATTDNRQQTQAGELLSEPQGPLELIFDDNQAPVGELTLVYSDQTGKLNLNWLLPQHPFAARTRDALTRLAQQAEVGDPLLVNAIVDWVDENSSASFVYQSKREPYSNSGTAFADLSELLLIDGMSQEKFNKLAPYLAVLPSDSRLNINSVTSEVWQALVPEVDFALVESVRTAGGVTLDTLLGGQEDEIREKFPKELLTSHSRYIRAVTLVELDERIYTRTSLLHWPQEGAIEVLRRRDGLDEPLTIDDETLTTGFAESL